ncbi:MAG: caspase family protein [Ignavibacteriaceae bacterium]|nr:caspase family protein [Ignavibacteriaceae bacterium]
MKKIIFINLIFILMAAAMGQTSNIKSYRTSLNIKFAPKDSIAPELTITSPMPNVIAGLPVYQRDTAATIEGKATDNVKVEKVLVNGRNADTFINDKFIAYAALKHGLNKVTIEAFDNQGNVTKREIEIFQDDKADITPPVIKIASFVKGRGINVVSTGEKGDSTKLQGSITDESPLHGVWMNDSLITLNSKNEFSLNFNTLPAELHLKAIDKFGNISIKTFNLENGKVAAQDSVVTGKYFALIIANQNYHDVNIPDLEFPVKDAKSLEKTLLENYTFNKPDVIFLENPDRAKIIKTLDNLSKKITSSDNFLIFYAGHGVWEADQQEGFWLPSNASSGDKSEWLSNGNVRDYIRGIKSKHTILIADACFGGAIFKTREVLINAPTSIKKMYDIPSRTAMTSGTLTAVPDESVFVNYLIQRLKDNRDKFMPAENLYYNIKDAVINNSPTNQTPQYGVISQAGDEGGGSFIFIHK